VLSQLKVNLVGDDPIPVCYPGDDKTDEPVPVGWIRGTFTRAP
jgi:hypothetical protein